MASLLLLGAWAPTGHAQTFSGVAAINSYFDDDGNGSSYALDEKPSLATDGAGHWVAVWHSSDPVAGTFGSDDDIFVSYSQDDGETWSVSLPLNDTAVSDSGDDASPFVATDGNGTWVAVWFSLDDLSGTIGADRDILFARSLDGGASWSSPAALNSNAALDGAASHDFLPRIVVDGSGNWVTLWYSSDPLGSTLSNDHDILVSRSSNGGVSWSPSVALNTNASTDSGQDTKPQLATDRNGNWVAVWESTEDLGGTAGSDSDILVSRSDDAGVSWSAPEVLHSNATSDTGGDIVPVISADGAGAWVALWQSYESLGGTTGTEGDILVSRSSNAGLSWSAPEALADNADTDTQNDIAPRLATDGLGAWVAVWYSTENLAGAIGSDQDLFLSFSDDAGVSWSPVSTLAFASSDSGSDVYPTIRSNGLGGWVIAWESTQIFGGDRDIAYVTGFGPDGDGDGVADGVETGIEGTDPALSDSDADVENDGDEVRLGTDPLDPVSHPTIFGAAAALGTNAASDSGGDLYAWSAADDASHWVAVWGSGDDLGGTIGSDHDILTTRSIDGGVSWSVPMSLDPSASSDSGNDFHPVVETDGAGTWIAAWHSADDMSGTIGSDHDILYSISVDDGVSWLPAAFLNSNAASDSELDGDVKLAADGLGNWVAIWESDSDLGATIGNDRDMLVAHSSDGGVSWSSPAALNSNAVGDSGSDHRANIATDGLGNWVVVWESNDTFGGTLGLDSDILVSRSSDAGVTWTPAEALNGDALTDSLSDGSPSVATDDSGAWLVAWHSQNRPAAYGSDNDLFTSRSHDAGATWSAPLVLNDSARFDAGTDAYVRLASDGVRSWVATWRSDEDLGGVLGADRDIFVARSSDAGESWTAARALAAHSMTDSADDEFPHVAADGAGNWIVAWHTNDTLGATIGTDWDVLFVAGVGPDTDGDALFDAAESNTHGTDPFDPDSDADGALDGGEWATGTDPLDPDTDDDGVCDGGAIVAPCNTVGPDNCPFVSNPLQTNGDAFLAGDLCQCGDVNDTGALDGDDLIELRRQIVAHSAANVNLDRCDVTADGQCDLRDATVIARLLGGKADSFQNSCADFQP